MSSPPFQFTHTPLTLNGSPMLSPLSPHFDSSAFSTPKDWSVKSWRGLPIRQQPDYSGCPPEQLDSALSTIRRLPPLVHSWEVDKLRSALADAAAGRRFLLQGGDCAERFADCSSPQIEAKLKILLQMSLVLTWGARIPTIRLMRGAGQYAKPRSSPVEKLPDGTTVPSFRGDNVNSFEPTAEARKNNPERLVTAHLHSAATLNYLRALIKSGYADLHESTRWDLSGVRDQEKKNRYHTISTQIAESLQFFEVCGVLPSHASAAAAGSEFNSLREVDLFTSHEGLVLEYEESVTRINEHGDAYNLGAHFLWIGNRTRAVDGAHVEYFRGLRNPIGIKVDSELSPDELIALLNKLDPNREPGKITLISRFGQDKVAAELPKLIKAVQADGRAQCTLWISDPMHSNTFTAANGLKTRSFDDILNELIATFKVHLECGSRLGGVHFELTGENVTECVGGPQQLQEANLPLNYTTYCDPRLNYLQSMEISFLIADMLKQWKEQEKSKRKFSFSSPPEGGK